MTMRPWCVLHYLVVLLAAVSFFGCAVDIASFEDDFVARTPAQDEVDEAALAMPAPTPPADTPPEERYPRLVDARTPQVEPAAAAQPDESVERLLRSLSLRKRIGQRFIAPVQGTRLTYGAGSIITDVTPAGFIIYPWNFRSADEVRTLTESLQFLAQQVTPGIGLLLCTDQEGGRVDTFRFDDLVRFPSAASIGRLRDPDLVRSAAYITGTQLRRLGVNMNLAPVLDIYETADDSIIGDRSFGGDPWLVASYVMPYLQGAREAGVIATAKHFPGHGVTAVDSHSELPIVATTLDQLAHRDLIPFVTAIESGVEVIMTAHVLFENIDPFFPATLSQVFLRDILREELAYDGVVMTDGLEMGAIRDNYSLDESLIRLFTLDVDLILLYTEYDVVDLVERVERLHRDGLITADDIDRGVRRVLRLKLRHGLAEVRL
jgi:beta-N-acetylhexosaminidase